MAEGGSKKSTSGSKDTTAPDLLRQEAGNSGGMGGPMAHIQCMSNRDGLRGRGESPGALVETGDSR